MTKQITQNDLWRRDDAPPPPGHNAPPYDEDAFLAMKAKASKWCDAGGEWAGIREIVGDATSAGKLSDYIEGARALRDQIEAKRKEEKAPHIAAGKAVDAAFNKLTAALDMSIGAGKRLIGPWLKQQQDAADEARRAAEDEARRELKDAESARASAEARNDHAGMAEAEARAKFAGKAAQAAGRGAVKVKAQGASGRGVKLVTHRSAKMTKPARALIRYMDHPEVVALLERLATAELRAKGGPTRIPGFETVTEKRAA